MTQVNQGFFEACWTLRSSTEPPPKKKEHGLTAFDDQPEIDPGMTAQKRHPNSRRFHELLEEAGRMHDTKQRDYGRAEDPFANVRATEEWGMPGWAGAMIRLHDKVRRLQALLVNGRLENETAIDSFMDIAVYALIARVLYEEDQPENLSISGNIIHGVRGDE